MGESRCCSFAPTLLGSQLVPDYASVQAPQAHYPVGKVTFELCRNHCQGSSIVLVALVGTGYSSFSLTAVRPNHSSFALTAVRLSYSLFALAVVRLSYSSFALAVVCLSYSSFALTVVVLSYSSFEQTVFALVAVLGSSYSLSLIASASTSSVECKQHIHQHAPRTRAVGQLPLECLLAQSLECLMLLQMMLPSLESMNRHLLFFAQ